MGEDCFSFVEAGSSGGVRSSALTMTGLTTTDFAEGVLLGRNVIDLTLPIS